MEKHPSDAAEDAVDEDRLIDGEDPSTDDRDDATHWMSVYRELVAFKADLISRSGSAVAGMRPAAAREVERTDLVVLRTEGRRLRRRLDFWTRRVDELGARDAR